MTTASNGGLLLPLPLHLLEEILLRLDAQTLFQCAFVCRSWNYLISSPGFIHSYSDRTFDSRKQILLIKVCRCEEMGSTLVREYLYFPRCQLTYSQHWDNDQFDLFRTVKSPTIDDFKNTAVIGVSNGLVCLASKLPFKFIIWNPTIKKYVWLPLPMTWDETMCRVGFGFDRNTNDFKVINVVHRYHKGQSPSDDCDEIDSVWVFSYVAWSWKRLACSFPTPIFVMPLVSPHVYLNGALYWIATRADEDYDFILAFDLTCEVFRQIPFPEDLGTDYEGWNYIVTTGDSLLVIQTKYAYDEEEGDLVPHVFSIWAMKQYGEHESWTNIFSTTALEKYPNNILGARKNGDLILGMYGGEVRRYSPTIISTNIPVRALENSVFFRYYNESLYLLEKKEDVISH